MITGIDLRKERQLGYFQIMTIRNKTTKMRM